MSSLPSDLRGGRMGKFAVFMRPSTPFVMLFVLVARGPEPLTMCRYMLIEKWCSNSEVTAFIFGSRCCHLCWVTSTAACLEKLMRSLDVANPPVQMFDDIYRLLSTTHLVPFFCSCFWFMFLNLWGLVGCCACARPNWIQRGKSVPCVVVHACRTAVEERQPGGAPGRYGQRRLARWLAEKFIPDRFLKRYH
jgi:hypothetical protein